MVYNRGKLVLHQSSSGMGACILYLLDIYTIERLENQFQDNTCTNDA